MICLLNNISTTYETAFLISILNDDKVYFLVLDSSSILGDYDDKLGTLSFSDLVSLFDQESEKAEIWCLLEYLNLWPIRSEEYPWMSYTKSAKWKHKSFHDLRIVGKSNGKVTLYRPTLYYSTYLQNDSLGFNCIIFLLLI